MEQPRADTPNSPHYKEVDANPNFVELEQKILDFWQKEGIFEQSVAERPAQKDGKNNEYIFYDGPPFANGAPHYGHLLTGYVKDLFARYHTMKGQRVERRFGWDCHGLPAEMAAEKALNVSGRQQIIEYGIGKFNDWCRSMVNSLAGPHGVWKDYVDRQARWVDMEHDYKTMDTSFMESVIWAFKQLHEKGLIYESFRVMPYSWAAETPLSNFETKLDNSYREREDKAITVAFELKSVPAGFENVVDKCFILAWTTTPWTLPSNLALAVHPEKTYNLQFHDNRIGYIFLNVGNASSDASEEIRKAYEKSQIASANGNFDGLKISTGFLNISGEKLLDLKYKPLFPYFKDNQKAFRIIAGEFITEGDGTGIVHIAPGFGEDDQRVGELNDVGIVVPVDGQGKFTNEIYDLPDLKLQGLNVIAENVAEFKFGEANERIIRWLKDHGHLIKQEQIKHNYPHCWRTDQPLIYRAMPSWYVEVTKFRDRAVELNKQIHWVPEHIRDGQMGHMLATAPDWSISRNRFWGTPIPIWRSDNPNNKELYVFGSIKELEEFFDTKVTDLHRPFIDELTKPDPTDPTYTLRRVEDVFDCWFESGSMPFAQVHYPFENKEWFDTHFPADFITEYVGQTRGWFNTLIMLSTALFDKPPFKHCVCHGVVLDAETGLKYSKRLKNFKDPMEVFDQFGGDALRWLMIASPVMRGQDIGVDPEGKFIRDVVRLAIKPIWNAYNFFCLYANVDGIEAKLTSASTDVMDSYILEKCNQAVAQIETALDAYDTPTACSVVLQFFDVLNNWYIRRSKERFWKEECDADKQAAYDTLYTVLTTMCRAAAPLLPFTLEEIYKNLTGEKSVHLASFPSRQEAADGTKSRQLISDMERVRDICNAALSIRNAKNIRVRQPLKRIQVIVNDTTTLNRWILTSGQAFASIIKDEINVKSVDEGDLGLDKYATLKLQLNNAVLGKRLPEKMKQIIPASKKGEWKQLENGGVEILGEALLPEEYSLLLEPKPEYKDTAQPLSTNDALVILDTTITPELEQEGIARDLVRMIQQARKDAGLNVADRIDLALEMTQAVSEAVEVHHGYISEQTLASSINKGTIANAAHRFEQTLDDEKIVIGLSKAG